MDAKVNCAVRSGRKFKFLIEVHVFDVMMSVGEMVKFIEYRLNLRNGAELGSVTLVDTGDENEKRDAA